MDKGKRTIVAALSAAVLGLSVGAFAGLNAFTVPNAAHAEDTLITANYTFTASNMVSSTSTSMTFRGDRYSDYLLLKMVNVKFDSNGSLALIDSTKHALLFNTDVITGLSSFKSILQPSDSGAYPVQAFSYEPLNETNYTSEDNPNVYVANSFVASGAYSSTTSTVSSLEKYRYFFIDSPVCSSLPTAITLSYACKGSVAAPT